MGGGGGGGGGVGGEGETSVLESEAIYFEMCTHAAISTPLSICIELEIIEDCKTRTLSSNCRKHFFFLSTIHFK